jgi:hypothetical protein
VAKFRKKYVLINVTDPFKNLDKIVKKSFIEGFALTPATTVHEELRSQKQQVRVHLPQTPSIPKLCRVADLCFRFKPRCHHYGVS